MVNKDLQKYTGIALGSGALPIALATAPEVAAAAAPHVGKIVKGARAVANVAKSKATEAATAATGAAIRNQDKINKAADVVMDIANPVPPAKTPIGQVVTAGLMGYDQYDRYQEQKRTNDKQKRKLVIKIELILGGVVSLGWGLFSLFVPRYQSKYGAYVNHSDDPLYIQIIPFALGVFYCG